MDVVGGLTRRRQAERGRLGERWFVDLVRKFLLSVPAHVTKCRH